MSELYAIEVNRRGEYSNQYLYHQHDLVTANGKEYLAVVASKGEDVNNPRFWAVQNKGKQGDPGKDGASAYQTWLEVGHAGSKIDFLNWLKGEKGDTGSPGAVNGWVNPVDNTKYSNLDELTGGPVFILSKEMVNQPVTGVDSSFLIVFGNTDNSVATQIWINPKTNDAYMRSKTDGKFSDWRWITNWN
ncbi:hypothetical protein FC35_GL000541 [Limosilactobacillus coleohominis DSM 14060]|nr:hypothetical protein FC35_GL000541 [Limosilactobacillus coleohominis DSM 14060]